jgi:aryl-alcohol dehydrogenase-like predicted oxidoreductase
MRYRPFGHTGVAVSALSLLLDGAGDRRRADEWRSLVHAAFEAGINAFELSRPSPALLDGFADGASAVKRALLFVALRADPTVDSHKLEGWVADAIARSGVGEVNLFTLEEATPDFEGALVAGLRLKDLNLVRSLAVAGVGEAMDEHVEDPLFDAVVTPFGLMSGWRERNLTRNALLRQKGVIACDPCPPEVLALAKEASDEAKPGLLQRRDALKGAGTYAFLQETRGWSAEQICLAYALTEPAVATVQMEITDANHLNELAEVTDRDLPSAVTAQIEMARFSAEAAAPPEERTKRRA